MNGTVYRSEERARARKRCSVSIILTNNCANFHHLRAIPSVSVHLERAERRQSFVDTRQTHCARTHIWNMRRCSMYCTHSPQNTVFTYKVHNQFQSACGMCLHECVRARIEHSAAIEWVARWQALKVGDPWVAYKNITTICSSTYSRRIASHSGAHTYIWYSSNLLSCAMALCVRAC